MPHSTNTTSPAQIVERALKRENVDPQVLGTYGWMWLVKGRPHLHNGFHALLSRPMAFFLALCQMAVMYIVVSDIDAMYEISHGRPAQAFLLQGMMEQLQAAFPGANVVYLCLLSAIPLFVVLNGLMGLMASAFCDKPFQLRVLLSALCGLIPLRLVAGPFLPKWWFYDGEWRCARAIQARVMQYSIAYCLAAGKRWKSLELVWAHALDRHLKVMVDAYVSCLLLPNLVFVGIALSLIALGLTAPQWIFNFIDTVYASIRQAFAFGNVNVFAAIAAWLAFERACLAAMTFNYLAQASRSPTPCTLNPSEPSQPARRAE